jgi:methyl-galactoside transport system substrate-binding protein
MRKLTVLAMLTAGMFGTQAMAETKVGVTVYKYDDNFMSVVRQALEKEDAADANTELLLNDSQNNQSVQNDQIDVMLARGVQALAINLVDPAAAPTIIQKAKMDDVPVVFYNKEPSEAAMASYDKAYYVGTNSKESGEIQGDLIAAQWKANPAWDKNGDGVLQYVMLKGEPGHPDAEARTTFAVKNIQKAGIKTDELHMDTGMWDTAMAKDKMDAWLSGPNGKKIEVVIANNDGMAMGAVEALRATGTMLPVFGVDALAEAIEMVKNGDMAGTVLNDAESQAKATFELARNLAEGKAAGEGTQWNVVNKVVRVPYVGVDKASLE